MTKTKKNTVSKTPKNTIKRVKEKKHRHKWIYDTESCPNCSYEERCCENCTVCQGREYNKKWEEVSN